MAYAVLLLMSLVVQPEPELEFPPLKAYGHSCPIKTSYDRFTDESVRTIELGRWVSTQGPSLILSVGEKFLGIDGKAATAKTKVHLIFAISKGFALPIRELTAEQHPDGIVLAVDRFVVHADVPERKRQKVFLLFEKGRIKDPPSAVSSEQAGYYAIYRVTVELTMRQFLDLVNSEWIECRVGELDSRLTREQRAGLKDFAARMAFDEATLKIKLAQAGIDDAVKRPKQQGAPIAKNAKKPDAMKRAAQAESRLRIATELEKIDRAPDAIAFYTEIVEDFSDCPQANRARQRLKVLQAPKKDE